MLTPEYLRRITEQSEEYASDFKSRVMQMIISRIVRRLERKDDYLFTPTDMWQMQVLQEAGYLLGDLQKEIAAHISIQQEEIKSSMEEAGIKALEYDDGIYRKAGLSPAPLKQSPHLIRIMQRSYEATNGEMRNLTRTTAEAAQRRFIEECDNAYLKVTTGAQSISGAVKEAIENISKDALRIHYPTGHSDTIETAVSRAVRTGVSQATGEIQIMRMDEMNWDIVLTSAHYGARTGDGGENPGNHYWWQGRFYSRTGINKNFPDFRTCTGYGTIIGLCGVNCRHSFGPGDGKNNPFDHIDSEENRRIEELNKQMRAKERRIRKTKQELLNLQAALDVASDERIKFELQQEYDRKAHLLKRQNADYKEFCKSNNAKTLQERLQIAKWNRQQAARANAAARRRESV